MASKNTLQLIHDFKGDIQAVYDHVLDLRKFGTLHHHMKEVKIVAQEPEQFIEYEIWEEVTLFGFVKMKPNYKAKVIEVEKHKQVKYLSQVEKNVHLAINFFFSENKEKGTIQVIEEIEVVGNKFVASIFMGILKKAHLQVFESLRANL